MFRNRNLTYSGRKQRKNSSSSSSTKKKRPSNLSRSQKNRNSGRNNNKYFTRYGGIEGTTTTRRIENYKQGTLTSAPSPSLVYKRKQEQELEEDLPIQTPFIHESPEEYALEIFNALVQKVYNPNAVSGGKRVTVSPFQTRRTEFANLLVARLVFEDEVEPLLEKIDLSEDLFLNFLNDIRTKGAFTESTSSQGTNIKKSSSSKYAEPTHKLNGPRDWADAIVELNRRVNIFNTDFNTQYAKLISNPQDKQKRQQRCRKLNEQECDSLEGRKTPCAVKIRVLGSKCDLREDKKERKK